MRLLGALLVCGAVSACGTTQGGGILDKTLELVGLQTIEAPVELPAASMEALKPSSPTRMPLRIHASDLLNSDTKSRPLSLVIQIYKLKNYEEFFRAPYKGFSEAKYAHEDVIAMREVVLIPGQRYEVEEPLPKDTGYLAVVALFKSPEETRWRFVFDVASSAKDGVTLGAHQCALSVSQGETVGSPPESRRLAGTVCR